MGSGLEQVSGEITGANRMANAAGGAARAQEAALARGVGFAKEGLAAGQKSGQDMINAAKSPQELAALRQSLSKQGQALDRQSKLFDSIDPAVLEASQQALQLLRGEEAKSLGPLKQQQDTQRKALVDRLREQLGPGAETSTAGMQALNQFDQQASQQLAGAQEQSLGNLFGIAQQGAQGRSALNQGAQSLASIGGMFGQAAGRMSQAHMGAGQLEQGGFSNLINAQSGLAAGSGSQFVSDQLKGQARMAQHGQAMEGAMSMMGSAAGCFPAGTLVKMADGSEKPINEIKLNEVLFEGGKVTRLLTGLADNVQWYQYRDILVTGTHAVRHEGKWIRVADIKESIPMHIEDEFLYNLSSEYHKIIIRDVIFSDMDEVDQYHLSYTDSLKAKNAS